MSGKEYIWRDLEGSGTDISAVRPLNMPLKNLRHNRRSPNFNPNLEPFEYEVIRYRYSKQLGELWHTPGEQIIDKF
jgi:hypothetical protein